MLAGRLDEKMAPGGQGTVARVRFVTSDEPWFDERGLDVERICFIQHSLDEALDGIFAGAVGPQARHAQSAGRRAEDQIPPGLLPPEVGQRRVDDVQRAHEVGLELVAQIVLVLVLARPDDAVARAVCDHVDAAKLVHDLPEDAIDRLPRAHVAQEAQAVFMDALHVLLWRLKDSPYRAHQIAVGQGAFDQRPAHVAGAAKDLETAAVSSETAMRRGVDGCAMRQKDEGNEERTIQTSFFVDPFGEGGSQLAGSCSLGLAGPSLDSLTSVRASMSRGTRLATASGRRNPAAV